MSFRYRKSINLGGGVRLNLSKSGVGISAGIKGFRISTGPRGSRATVSIPGTGLSFTHKLTGHPSLHHGVVAQGPPHPAPYPTLHCFACHEPLSDGADACGHCGRLIVQGVSQYGYSRAQYAALVVGIATVVGLALFATWLIVAHHRETERLAAIRAAQERQIRIRQELYTLQAQNPVARFALYPGNGHSVAMNTRFSTCQVRRIDFSRSGDTLDINVNLVGIRPDAQAPIVNVTVYDEHGNLLSRSAIVKFRFSNLGQGEVRDINDQMDVPHDGTPVFMSIDECDS